MLNRVATVSGGIIFLIVAALALYRLLVGFRITIGDMEVGQTSTFIVLVVCTAMSLMLFRHAAVRN